MKKLFYLVAFTFILVSASSCTPQKLEDSMPSQACCGDDFSVPPPPSKSPIGG